MNSMDVNLTRTNAISFNSAIDSLNPEQKIAALHKEGPAVVFAGAGSGKTRVICSRISNLIQNHSVPPYAILAVTFTNKAAKEMLVRIEKSIGPSRIKSISVSTFHAFCAKYLRIFATEAGYEKSFSIFDDDDQKGLFKDILKSLNISDKILSSMTVRYKIDKIKNRGITVEEYGMLLREDKQFYQNETGSGFKKYGEVTDPFLIYKIYHKYQERLKSLNAMDFNDLLLVMYQTIKNRPDVLESLQSRYQYFLIDEFQDTNPLQFQLVKLLSSHNQNLFIVGDDDQSIYSWRGAEPSFIIDFSKIFPNAKVFKLEENYRSTANIIEAANALVKNNKFRAQKNLHTKNCAGEKITLKSCYDAYDEARFIVNEIFDKGTQKTETGDTIAFQDFCVLYRTNAQSRSIEDELRRRMVPYLIYGSVRFYERAEIKILLSYMKLLVNPKDDVSFEKVVNTPRRGIGDTALEKLKEKSLEVNLGLLSLSQNIFSGKETLSLGRAATGLRQFTFLMDRWTQYLNEGVTLASLLADIVQEIEFNPYIETNYPEDADDRKLNIIELKNAFIEYESLHKNQEEVKLTSRELLSQFIEQAMLTVEPKYSDKNKNESKAVTLMTIHSSKGLEFPNVFICGLEENTLPHYNSVNDPQAVEEERRLLYVAITRAQNRLTLSHIKVNRFKSFEPAFPSRFLTEIPVEVLNISDKKTTASPTFFSRNSKETEKNESKKSYPWMEEPGTQWCKGQRVLHAKFGEGTILGVESSTIGFKLRIHFDDNSEKILLHTYVSLI